MYQRASLKLWGQWHLWWHLQPFENVWAFTEKTNISVRVNLNVDPCVASVSDWVGFRLITELHFAWPKGSMQGMVEQTEHQHTLKCTLKYNLTLPLGISTRVEWLLYVRRHSQTVGKITKHQISEKRESNERYGSHFFSYNSWIIVGPLVWPWCFVKVR